MRFGAVFVHVERRECRFAASIARNMRAAGWGWRRIGRALRVSPARAERLALSGTMFARRWREEMRRAA
ncbi:MULTISPECIES: hypothetical protein [Methylosinus]|uniref:hypothetical protein n=1 Tax=Methylosinus TaxID=425 RepID=UPI0001D2F408|nr:MULTISPECIES: hypothetical protein [Methylosinus]OBS51821.1 hypothetical protein A8B73_14280 [Methylosinus sp. 3S-1]